MKVNLTLVGIIIVSLGLCYFFASKWNEEKKERIRINSNYINEVNAKKEAYTQLNIKVKELEQIKPKLDSIVKANRIKPKNIEKVITYETKIKWDTIPFVEHKPISDSTHRMILVAGIDNCFTSEGLIDLTQTSIYPTSNDVDNIMFTLFNTIVNDEGGVIYYTKRDTTKWLRLWPFAKKKYYSKGYSKCGSKVEIQEINFIKK